MNISVLGTGYVGLVSGLCLSTVGHNVICVDNDKSKVEKLNSGIPTIHEYGLPGLLKENLGKNFFVTSDLNDAIAKSELTIVAVGTPFDGKKIDLKYIEQASKDIAEILKTIGRYHVVVVKSTVVPGTTTGIVKETIEKYSNLKAGQDFGLGMNPEFLREGVAINDFNNPDRIVVGGIDDKSISFISNIYQKYTQDGVPLVACNCQTAEMIKYTSNSFFAMLISYANEIDVVCNSLKEVNSIDVLNGLILDKRIKDPSLSSPPEMAGYLKAGAGFGGSCFPKDVKALASFCSYHGISTPILDSILETNKNRHKVIIDILSRYYSDLSNLKIGVLGLSFKAETDDVRESKSIELIKDISGLVKRFNVFDPQAMNEAQKVLVEQKSKINFYEDSEGVIKDSDVIILMTAWKDFINLPKYLAGRDNLVIDTRAMFNPDMFEKYEGIGYASPNKNH